MLNNFWIITFLHTQKGNRYSQSELTLLWILKKQKKSNKEQKAKFPQLNEAPSHSLITLPKTPNQPPQIQKKQELWNTFGYSPILNGLWLLF